MAEFTAKLIDVPRYPLYMRPNTSDLANYSQIFFDRCYACAEVLRDVELIVDCGAYAGYSAAWFLSKFKSRYNLIAIEPDAQNFKMLEVNAEPFSRRITCVNAAIWTHENYYLKKLSGKYRDGREWSYQYGDFSGGKIPTESISSLMLKYALPRCIYKISLLKIDIEGAEVILFKDAQHWLDLVDNIAIELHDDTHFGNATQTFVNACADQFTIQKFGEITFAQRRK